MTPEGGNELEGLKRQVQVLTTVANQLADRLYALEDRLARIEQPSAAALAPSPPPRIIAEEPPAFVPPVPVPAPPPVTEPVHQAPQIETQVGLKLLNRLGAITVILGVAFTFKYAADNQYIGEGGRVILGVMAAAIVLAAGDRLWHRDQKVYAQGVTGLGIAILYLSFYAAFGLYHLIPQTADLLLLVLTTASAGALALRYDSRAIAILGLLGGYATLPMLSTGTPNDTFFAVYLAILNGAVLWVARQRRWGIVELFALLGTMTLHGAWIADRSSALENWLGVGASLVQYGLFVFGQYALVAGVAQIFFPAAMATIHWHPLVQLIFVVAGLGIFYWRKREFGPAVTFAGWWVAYTIGRGFIWRHAQDYTWAYLTAGFLIFLAWPVWLALYAKQRPGRFALTTMALSGAAYFSASYEILHGSYGSYMGLLAVTVGATYLAAGWALWGSNDAPQRDSRSAILSAGLAMAFLALAVPIQFSGYRIAIAWAIQAAALAFIGSRLPDKRVLLAATLLALLALVDLPFGMHSVVYSPILNPSFVTMAVVAASFWVIAYFTSKTPDLPGIIALPSYVIGHLVMLAALHWEVFSFLDWTGRSSESKLLASSLLLALYGIALLGAGVQTRTVVNRVMGLILFAAVILKLYLSDVWVLGRLFQIIAFLALGGLLLGGSYLYSHYRGRLETLVKKDEARA
jgi:uncharacterized membrane protein